MSRTLRVRQSQTVVPFGVGAVFDIQGESFVATGIDGWPTRGRQPVSSPRLASRLVVTGFYAAPATGNDRFDTPDAHGAPYIRFPSWLFCGACRRMKRWRIADEQHGQAPRCLYCSPTRTPTPMRFVQICAAGHLGDVDWWFWAHSRRDASERRQCGEREKLRFLVSERASGLEALSVACTAKGCGASRGLLDILGTHGMRCSGRNPWQRSGEATECVKPVQVVQRTAGNLYYPVMHSALDIPETDTPAPTDDALAAKVRDHDLWVSLCKVAGTGRAEFLREMIQEDTGADDALLDALVAEETGPVTPSGPAAPYAPVARPDLSREEWAAFTAPVPPATRDFALRESTLGLSGETAQPWAGLQRAFGKVVLADRLREVRALSGFTRVSPDATLVPADTARRLKWLPAVEVFGEGLFLTVDRQELGAWEADKRVLRHVAALRADRDRSFQKDRLETLTGPDLAPRFVLLHTLAHLLIRQLSFESGYTTASLRERIYARPEQDQYGILVYTAAGDAEGTLGGLVRQGEPLPEFYRLCRVLGARTTVFADECQRLTETNSTLAEIAQRLGRCARHELDGNHRNTRQIASLAAHFHTGSGLPPIPERDGAPARLHRIPERGAADLLILLAEQHPRHTIGVIVHFKHTQFSLLGTLENRAPRLKPQLYTSQARGGRYRRLDLDRPGIVLVHRRSAKGLCFDTVVVPDTHTDAATDPSSAALRMEYYVMATRARRELHFAHEGESEPPLLAAVGSSELLRG